MAPIAPRYLDHVVVTTPDLSAAVRDLESVTGVAPEPGGVHPTFGTRNYLVSFGGDCYLEILGADPQNHDFTGVRPFGVDDATETATSTWAIHPPQISEAVTAARSAGIDPGEPYDGSRRTADGTLLQWRLTKDHAEPSGVVPFLLDWGETVSPARTTTPRLGLVALVATHPEPARVRAVLSALGTDLEVGEGPAALRLTVEGPSGRMTL